MSTPKREKFARLSDKQVLSCSLYHPETSARRLSAQGKPQNLREGLLFNSMTKYAVGDLLRLKLAIPLLNSTDAPLAIPVTLIGNVVRVAMQEGGSYQIGVCFTKLDQQYRSRLLESLADKHVCAAKPRKSAKENAHDTQH